MRTAGGRQIEPSSSLHNVVCSCADITLMGKHLQNKPASMLIDARIWPKTKIWGYSQQEDIPFRRWLLNATRVNQERHSLTRIVLSQLRTDTCLAQYENKQKNLYLLITIFDRRHSPNDSDWTICDMIWEEQRFLLSPKRWTFRYECFDTHWTLVPEGRTNRKKPKLRNMKFSVSASELCWTWWYTRRSLHASQNQCCHWVQAACSRYERRCTFLRSCNILPLLSFPMPRAKLLCRRLCKKLQGIVVINSAPKSAETTLNAKFVLHFP